MAEYSDNLTVGEQVIAHRYRMVSQNIALLLSVSLGLGFLFFVIFSLFHWQIKDLWNYVCFVKASWRTKASISPGWFDSSFIITQYNQFKEISDFVLLKSAPFIKYIDNIETSLLINLKYSICVATISLVSFIIINIKFGRSLRNDKDIVSGYNYVTEKELIGSIKDKSDINLGHIPYPKGTEALHTLITGTTGSGKTNLMVGLLNQIIKAGDRAVIVDTVGTFAEMYQTYGTVLNPGNQTPNTYWDLLNECDSENVISMVSECLIGSDTSHDKFWEDAARVVFCEAAKKAKRTGKSTQELLNLLLNDSFVSLYKYLEHTPAHSLMDPQADKMAISIRAVLINSLASFSQIQLNNTSNYFNIKNWILRKDHLNFKLLFLSCSPVERASFVPIISAWLAIASDATLHGQTTLKRTWFIIDELHSLRRIPKIEGALAEVRKFGGCFVIGTQTVNQLSHIYGDKVAKTIISLCGNKVVMSTPEPETANYMSGFFGQKEELTVAESISYGANTVRDGATLSQQLKNNPTVPPSEIMNLHFPDAFVKFSSINLPAKVSFPGFFE